MEVVFTSIITSLYCTCHVTAVNVVGVAAVCFVVISGWYYEETTQTCLAVNNLRLFVSTLISAAVENKGCQTASPCSSDRTNMVLS